MSARQSVLNHGLGITPDLDAHMYDWMQKIKVEAYFDPVPINLAGSITLTANAIEASPFIVTRAMTIDRLQINVTGAGAGGTVARLGIYNNGTDLYPGTLLLDAGTVATDGVAVVAATISQALTKGLYWVVIVSDGTPTIKNFWPSISIMGNHPTLALGPQYCYSKYSKAAVGIGALAATFPSGGTISYYGALIRPRLLTLD